MDSLKDINTKSLVTYIIGAVITGVVALVVGLTLYFFQAGGTNLEYKISESIPFTGGVESVAIYRVDVYNNGSKMIENVFVNMELPDSIGVKISQGKVTSDSLPEHQDTIGGNSYKVHVNNMNPKESLTISFLATASSSLPIKPIVVVRADHVMGKEAIPSQLKGFFGLTSEMVFTLGTAMIAAYSAVLAGIFFKKYGMFLIPGGDLSQKENFMYLCNVYGLSNEADFYASTQMEITYRSEADRLSFKAIQSKDNEKIENTIRLLEDVNKYGERIAPQSKAVIKYNVARLLKALGRIQDARDALAESKKHGHRVIEQRIAIESDYWKGFP